jgi:aspartate/methionine/tyrosine aminotransferase
MQVHGMAQAIGARTKELNLDERNGFRADLEQLQEIVSSKTKIIQLTNPNNPTGNKFSSDEVREICEIAERRELCCL